MRVSIALTDFLRDHLEADGQLRRGMITKMAKEAGIERHTFADLVNNSAKAIKLETLARLSEYLATHHGVDRSLLPGSLLTRDPEHFLDTLARCQRLDFCIGRRIATDWKGSEYVMDSDTLLQSELANRIASYAMPRPPNGQDAEDGPLAKPPGQPQFKALRYGRPPWHIHFPRLHLVSAPPRRIGRPGATNIDAGWQKVCQEAQELYHSTRNDRTSQAWIAVGSPKVCPLGDLVLAKAFGGKAFVRDKAATPQDRRCPLFIRYRENDPQPPSNWAGLKLARCSKGETPGIYYETEDGRWECCPWDNRNGDAAFLFYYYRRKVGYADVACGGFSSRSTRCLSENLEQVIDDLGAPQYESNTLIAGLYVIEFTFDPEMKPNDHYRDQRQPIGKRVIPLAAEVLRRRLPR